MHVMILCLKDILNRAWHRVLESTLYFREQYLLSSETAFARDSYRFTVLEDL